MNEYSKVGWQDGTVLQQAKVTIDDVDYEVEPAVESGTTPVNATNLDKMDTALKQAHDGVRSLSANKIDKSTIELLTVDSTAPITCSEGDMYYNTTTNLIYTATGTDTWGTTGETPSSKYLYVDLTNSKLYYYDGATFTSYGGGSSNDVVISPTEPTVEDWKLWIDSDEVQNVGSELPLVYPVGSIYMSVNNTNPATLFGFGTWEQIQDTFLLAAGSTYTAGATGGEATHTLTVDEIPSHNHKITGKIARSEASSGNLYTVSNQRFLLGKYKFSNNNVSATDDTAAFINVSDLNTQTMIGIDNKGGGQEHNNMPPYLTVYMWKRTA